MTCTPLARTSPKQRARLAAYAKVRKAWLAEHSRCAVCLLIGMETPSTEPHHMRGRVGSLLCDTRFWIPICPDHHRFIHDHPAVARSNGWLASANLWNVPVPLEEHER